MTIQDPEMRILEALSFYVGLFFWCMGIVTMGVYGVTGDPELFWWVIGFVLSAAFATAGYLVTKICSWVDR